MFCSAVFTFIKFFFDKYRYLGQYRTNILDKYVICRLNFEAAIEKIPFDLNFSKVSGTQLEGNKNIFIQER